MSHPQESIFLAGLDYALGEEDHDLDELQAVLPGVRESLRESGLDRFRTSQMTPIELAGESLRKTLVQLPATWPSDITHLIYATNSMWDKELLEPAPLGNLLITLGIEQAYPYGIFLSYCANLQCAFDLGASIIRSGRADHVLVVCTDKAEPTSDRLVRPRVSIHSDGAASFAMTREQLPGCYRLLATVLTISPDLGEVDPDVQFVDYLNGTTAGVVDVVRRTLATLDLKPNDVVKGFTNNYNRAVATMMGKLAGFETEQLYLENVPRFAHALAADAVINVVDWATNETPQPDLPLLVLSTGPIQWGCSILAPS